jgi:hypothetical protein
MTPDELLSQLAPVRIPAEFAALGLRDVLLFIALGIVTALVMAPLLRRLTVRRPSQVQQVRDRVATLRDLRPEERIVGLAALLRRLDPAAPLAGVRPGDLYDPRAAIDPMPLERSVLSAAARKRRRA